MSTSEQLNTMLEEIGISITIYDYGMREPKIVIDTFRHDKQVRADERNKTIDDCLVLVDKIMPPQPYLLKSKHYENWKMKTTELRMLRDMLEQLKGAEIMDLKTRLKILPCGKCEDMMDCDNCIFAKEAKELYKQIREETIEFISDKLIYPLLDECDRGLWEHISHIELAEEWVKVLNDNPYPKVKNHTEARKRDLRQWIAERLKGEENG